MIWKLRGSRTPAHSGVPTLPDLRASHRFRAGRARTAACSRSGEKSDDHVFVTYRSPQGFSLKVPASWTRMETPSNVAFEGKHHRIEVSIVDVNAPPITARALATRFARKPRTVAIRCVGDVKLPAGRSIQIRFTSVFERSPAVSNEIRFDSERYLITGRGKMAVLTLCAPAVVQAADLWKTIADSFRW